MARQYPAERRDMAHVARFVVGRARAQLEAEHDAQPIEFLPERRHLRRVEGPGKAVAAHRIDVEVETAELQRAKGMVDLGELGRAARHRLVDMHQPGHAVGILTLGEGVHLRHRPVAAARLQQAVIDAGIHHLRQHQLRRRRHLLHADRHVLDDVVLARVGELELAEAADPEIDVGEPAPARIVGAEQRARVGARPVARAEGRAAVRVIMRCR